MLDNLKLWLSAGLGSGFLPKSPGTWGSIAALLPLYFILNSPSPFLFLLLFTVLSCLINFWVAGVSEKTWGEDPSKMVIDEFAGQSVSFWAVAILGSPFSIFLTLLLGFVFFRFFDILKPLGIYHLQKLKGGWGILVDDLLAGVYAMLCLQVVILLLG